MKSITTLLLCCCIIALPACEFNCSLGKKQDDPKGVAITKNGTRLYNNIEMTSPGVQVSKAYLILEDGQRVPDDNAVDFTKAVQLQLFIDSGWVEKDGKVLLGASEKIVAENGSVILDQDDLFEKYPDGISMKDAKTMYLSASVRLKENAAPTSFTVSFKVWDKNGDGYIKGSYKLYSK